MIPLYRLTHALFLASPISSVTVFLYSLKCSLTFESDLKTFIFIILAALSISEIAHFLLYIAMKRHINHIEDTEVPFPRTKFHALKRRQHWLTLISIVEKYDFDYNYNCKYDYDDGNFLLLLGMELKGG